MFDEIRNKMEAVIVILMDKIAAGHGLQLATAEARIRPVSQS
jgi:hypothetical protein